MANNLSNLQYNPQNSQMPQMPLPYTAAMPMMPASFQTQTIFMQPIGSVYGLGASSEVGNIPISSGVSIGLCLPEGTMYLKSMQNGGPVLLGYKLSPLEQSAPAANELQEAPKTEDLFKKYDAKIAELENRIAALQHKGGKSEWQL